MANMAKLENLGLNSRLVEKYGGKVLMYTEYPPKKFWSKDFGDSRYRTALKDFLTSHADTPVLLYIHIPFCHTQCLFCTCRVEILKKYADVRNYLRLIYTEIELLRRLFEEIGVKPNFREVYLGGGSPTCVKTAEFEELMTRVRTIADMDNLIEFSIEIDPRRVDDSRMRYYSSKGINRISFGIQDFDPEVQKAVNRIQPALLIEKLIKPEIRKLFKNGVNFDIICGLPCQTTESIRKTFQKIVSLSPDRVCLNYMDFAPHFNPHQLLMPQEKIPGPLERKLLFIEAMEILLSAGYVRTGYDHFAKPTDAVAQAMVENTMIWNSFGVTPGRCIDIIGLGIHSYGRIGPEYYFQNFYELDSYEQSLKNDCLPIFRGVKLSADDMARRTIIHRLRSYFILDFSDVEKEFSINFPVYFEKELNRLGELENEGLVVLSDNRITISDHGRQFANQVCKVFDIYT